MTRNIPMRTKKPKKKLETDVEIRRNVIASISVPEGTRSFKEGYVECLELFSLHAPDKKNVGRILDSYCIELENDCIRSNMVRDAMSRYEGYRQAMKDLKKLKKIR